MIHRKTLLQKVKDVVHSIDPQATIILFGSRARNTHKKDSDWDFMVLTNTNFDWKVENELRKRLYYDVELKTDQSVYATMENIQKWDKFKTFIPFYKNVAKEGIKI